jgi:hypothetical protein
MTAAEHQREHAKGREASMNAYGHSRTAREHSEIAPARAERRNGTEAGEAAMRAAVSPS